MKETRKEIPPDCQSKMADGGGLASSKGLEQFVLLAKSAKGAAVVELINQALAAPGVFVFGELLEMSSVKEVGWVADFTVHTHVLRCLP